MPDIPHSRPAFLSGLRLPALARSLSFLLLLAGPAGQGFAAMARLEVETLTETHTGGTPVGLDQTLASPEGASGHYVKYPFTTVGDYVTFQITVPTPGTYNIRVGTWNLDNRGKFQAYIGTTAQGEVFDTYGPSSGLAKTYNLGSFTFVSSGTKNLKLQVVGKHANSSNYTLGIDYIQLTAVDPTMEGESLTVAASSGDTVSNVSLAAASGGSYSKYAANNSPSGADYISYTVNFPEKGIYTINTAGVKTNASGKYQMSIDGTNVGGVVDLYAASTQVATTSVDYTVTTIGDKTVKFTVTTKNGSSSGYAFGLDKIDLQKKNYNGYDYQFTPSYVPTATGQVVVWNVPSSGAADISDAGLQGTDWSKYLLVVMPNSAVQVQLTMLGLKYRGVFIIGGQFDKVGNNAKTNPDNGHTMNGGNVIKVNFVAGASAAGVRPFVFLSNIDFDISKSDGTHWNSYWGDFLQPGTDLNGTSDNFGDFCDIYFQKTKIRNGHYFFTATGGDNTPHSDVFQATQGGWRNFYAANLDLKWYGQTFYTVPVDGIPAHPDGRVEFSDIYCRPMPTDTYVYPSGKKQIWYLKNYNANCDAPNGIYYSASLRRFNCLPQSDNGTGNDNTSYFGVSSYVTSSAASGLVNFSNYQGTGHAYPVIDGPDTFSTMSAPSPLPVPDADVGLSLRVTTAQQLIDILN